MAANIYYCKPGYQDIYRWGAAGCKAERLPLPTAATVKETHALVTTVDTSSPDEAWMRMQAEFWSPNGEAAPLIFKLGLDHTSMSVGDVVEVNGIFYMVEPTGFCQLEKE